MTTALIDADILAYQAALECQSETNWGDGIVTKTADAEAAERVFDQLCESTANAIFADEIVLAVTDTDNWRHALLPSYKGNRDPEKKPLLVGHLRDYAVSKGAFRRPGLEGDDCLGILATSGKYKDPVICSIDKDFKCIPGEHYNFGTKLRFSVSPKEADLWHMRQTLSGDTTDFYKGCPGVGNKGADAFVDNPYEFIMEEYTPKRGPNKGITRTIKHAVRLQKRLTPESLWRAVVSIYEWHGLTEADALIQARVARICRASDYDFHKRQVIYWSPPR